MSAASPSLVHAVRRFNRFYINMLGLMDKSIYHSGFSLPEARILYELYHGGGQSAKQLTGKLIIDPGYFSRLLKGLEAKGLILRTPSTLDGRSHLLYLTDLGKETFLHLDNLSDKQMDGLLCSLPEKNREALEQSIIALEKAFAQEDIKQSRVVLRQGLAPGDAGQLIAMHGFIYRKECSYGYDFEGYVCKTFYEFLTQYNEEKDGIWFAEDGGRMIGAIAIIGHTKERAQLRWFILHPDYRGIGLGKRLMAEAMQFVQEKGYLEVFLLTTKDQQTAIAMYEKAGFKKVSENKTPMWGKNLAELTYEWRG